LIYTIIYYSTDNGILLHGDCLEIMKKLPCKSIDLVLTDIPYNEVNRPSNGLRNLDKKDADIFNMDINNLIFEMIRIVKGSVYIFCGWSQLAILKNKMMQSGMTTRVIIWEKTNPSPMNGDFVWLSGIEPAVYGKKKKATFNLHCKNTVLRHPSGKSKIHPTQKPINLFIDLLKASSNKNNLILDPFLGSGTTAVACEKMGRRWIGIEISEEYCKIAKERIEQERKQLKLGL